MDIRWLAGDDPAMDIRGLATDDRGTMDIRESQLETDIETGETVKLTTTFVNKIYLPESWLSAEIISAERERLVFNSDKIGLPERFLAESKLACVRLTKEKLAIVISWMRVELLLTARYTPNI